MHLLRWRLEANTVVVVPFEDGRSVLRAVRQPARTLILQTWAIAGCAKYHIRIRERPTLDWGPERLSDRSDTPLAPIPTTARLSSFRLRADPTVSVNVSVLNTVYLALPDPSNPYNHSTRFPRGEKVDITIYPYYHSTPSTNSHKPPDHPPVSSFNMKLHLRPGLKSLQTQIKTSKLKLKSTQRSFHPYELKQAQKNLKRYTRRMYWITTLSL